MKGKWMKIVRQYTIITLGISMMAVGVYFFKFPNNFVFGGVTGAAALAAKLTPISASEFSAVVNMLMLLLGPDQPAAELYRPFRAAHRVRTAGAAGKHRHHGGSGAGELVGEQQLHPRSH